VLAAEFFRMSLQLKTYRTEADEATFKAEYLRLASLANSADDALFEAEFARLAATADSLAITEFTCFTDEASPPTTGSRPRL